MRALLISELHANWPAFEVMLAAESFDRLPVIGDLVSYGPHAAAVVDFVKRQATLAVRRDHDEALAHWADWRYALSSKPLAEPISRWSCSIRVSFCALGAMDQPA